MERIFLFCGAVMISHGAMAVSRGVWEGTVMYVHLRRSGTSSLGLLKL